MSAAKMVADQIFGEVFENGAARYVDYLENGSVADANSAYEVMIKAYRLADEKQKKAIVDFIKIVISDTASIILGGLDGVTDLGNLAGEIEVNYDGERVNGDLQEYFLMNVEDAMR